MTDPAPQYDWKAIGNTLAICAVWGGLQFLVTWGSGAPPRAAAMAAIVTASGTAANQLQRTGTWLPTLEGIKK